MTTKKEKEPVKKEPKFKVGDKIRYSKDLFAEYEVVSITSYDQYCKTNGYMRTTFGSGGSGGGSHCGSGGVGGSCKVFVVDTFDDSFYYIIRKLGLSDKIIIEGEFYLHDLESSIIKKMEVNYFLEKSIELKTDVEYLKKQIKMLKSSWFGSTLFIVAMIMLYSFASILK